MNVWPVTLPQYVNQDGYTQKRISGKIETEMDTGPAVMRNRFTATPVVFNLAITMTNAEVTVLENFYVTTCKNGTEEFTWLHPRTGAGAVMRFIGEPPDIRHLSGSDSDFVVTFTVEIMP